MAECWSVGWDMWVCPLNTKHDLFCLLTLSPLYCWITSPMSQQNTVQSLNLPREGCYMHKKTTGKVSSAFLTERLYGTDRWNSDSCPNKQETLVEWLTLKFMACVGTLTIFMLFFLSLKVTIFVSLCCLDKLMFFYRTREKFMAACRCC